MELVEALLTTRQVTEAKHRAYKESLNEECLCNMTLQWLVSLLRKFDDPAAIMASTKRAKVAALLFK